LERITELADIEVPKTPVVQIISIGQDSECNKLIRKLRKEGISCIINNDKVGKALEYANATDIPYVLLVGSEEIAKKKYKLKNMKSGNEEMLTDKQLIKKLS
jgi:histidyl-tRNA synthetase